MKDTSHSKSIPICPDLDGILNIAEISLPNKAVIGIIPCPGRNHVDTKGRRWRRDLVLDLDVIQAWGADAILTLLESFEFDQLGVPNFSEEIDRRKIPWYHLPIPDMSPPKQEFFGAWYANSEHILQHLKAGNRIIVHCAAGLGRSGMLASILLVTRGMTPFNAISSVRKARPGSVETQEQEEFVHHGLSLLRKRYYSPP